MFRKTNRLPPEKAHSGIRTASSQADSELIAVEDGDPEKTNLTSSHSAVEDSQTFDSEGEANQTCPSPTTDSESEGEKVDLKAAMSRKSLQLDLLSSFVTHILESTSANLSHHEPVPHEHHLGSHSEHPGKTQRSDTEISSSESDVPLTIPKDAKVKYSVIDRWNSRAKHCHQLNMHLDPNCSKNSCLN